MYLCFKHFFLSDAFLLFISIFPLCNLCCKIHFSHFFWHVGQSNALVQSHYEVIFHLHWITYNVYRLTMWTHNLFFFNQSALFSLGYIVPFCDCSLFTGDDGIKETVIEHELLSEAETAWAQREWSIQHVLFPAMKLFLKPPTSMATNGTFVRVSSLFRKYFVHYYHRVIEPSFEIRSCLYAAKGGSPCRHY